MLFNKILVPVEGSECSQIAMEYAFWLAERIACPVSAQHVVDPRLLDLLLSQHLAEALGFNDSLVASGKVLKALESVGGVILELFKKQAAGRKVRLETLLDYGFIVDSILEKARYHDLIIIGHHAKGESRIEEELMIGSVAERVAVHANCPVLVASRPVTHIKEILVAFDGSEPSVGALLLGESLSMQTGLPLKAVTVARTAQELSGAHLTVEQGMSTLKHVNAEGVFSVLEGPPAKTILAHAVSQPSLLVVGSYGYKTPEENVVLGSTTTGVIRKSTTSVLIYRQARPEAERFHEEMHAHDDKPEYVV